MTPNGFDIIREDNPDLTPTVWRPLSQTRAGAREATSQGQVDCLACRHPRHHCQSLHSSDVVTCCCHRDQMQVTWSGPDTLATSIHALSETFEGPSPLPFPTIAATATAWTCRARFSSASKQRPALKHLQGRQPGDLSMTGPIDHYQCECRRVVVHCCCAKDRSEFRPCPSEVHSATPSWANARGSRRLGGLCQGCG